MMTSIRNRSRGAALALLSSLSLIACEPRGGGDPADMPDMSPSTDMMEEVFKPGTIRLGDTEGVVSEGGDTARFALSLSREPDDDVLVIATSLDPGEGRVISPPLTFNASNWDTPQELTVQGVDDPFADRDQEYPVALVVLSNDGGFKAPRPIRMTTTDDDEAAYWVDVIEDTMAEDRSRRAQVRVRIATPPATTILFDLELSDVTEGALSQPQLEFAPGDPLEAFLFIDGLDDFDADGDQQVLLTLTPIPPGDKSYALLGPTSADLISIDGVCGNNVLEAVEGCDDGNRLTEVCDYGLSCCTVCNSQCEEAAGELTGFCGDELIQSPFEECDGDVTQLCGLLRREHGDARCIQSCGELDLTGCHHDQATQLTVGTGHACYLATQGDQMPQALRCWGENRSGESTIPDTVNGPGLIAAGDETTCVGQGNSVICWGEWGLMMPIPFFNTNGDVTALDVGGKRMCALSSMGELTCYNFNTRTTSSPPTPEQGEVVVDVKVGARHGCWLNSAGGVKCWGFLDEILTPPANVTFTSISVGAATACGIATTGELHCWGESPMIFGPSGDDFVHVSVGYSAACALRQDQSVVCWGDPRVVDEAPDASRRFATVEVGAQGACGIFGGGDIHCWGRGDSHRVANLNNNHSVEELVAGRSHVCALTDADEVSCWGGTGNGATDLPPGARPLTIAAGNDYTCYYDDSLDELVCLGAQGIVNNMPWSNSQTQLSGRADVVCATTGFSTTCRGNDAYFQESNYRHFALDPSGERCIAPQQGGLVGDCAPDGQLPALNVCREDHLGDIVGAEVSFWELAHATHVSAQEEMTCVALEPAAGCMAEGVGGACCCPDGSPGCCNMNDNTQLRIDLCNQSNTDHSVYCFSSTSPGDYIRIGPTGDANYPQEPLRPETLVSGRSHSCVLDLGERIHCWGDDTFGQSSPPNDPLDRFVSLVAGEDFTCAVDEHGRYTCWGALVMPLR